MLDLFDKDKAGEISLYIAEFKKAHSNSLNDFNKVCFEVVSRILWRYEKYGFYKENQNK